MVTGLSVNKPLNTENLNSKGALQAVAKTLILMLRLLDKFELWFLKEKKKRKLQSWYKKVIKTKNEQHTKKLAWLLWQKFNNKIIDVWVFRFSKWPY